MNIKFTYSFQYDQALNEGNDPDESLVQSRVEEMQSFWDINKEDIILAFKRITSFSFCKSEVACYLNSEVSISDPLSIKIEDVEEMQDSLIHELTHVLFIQNNNGESLGWKKLENDLESESHATRIHVLVHAIHYLIAEKLFPTRLVSIETCSKHPDYIRSWEIINKEGAQNIVNKYLL